MSDIIMHEEGFEPSHLTIVGLKSTALDHSAIRAFSILVFDICIFHLKHFYFYCGCCSEN